MSERAMALLRSALHEPDSREAMLTTAYLAMLPEEEVRPCLEPLAQALAAVDASTCRRAASVHAALGPQAKANLLPLLAGLASTAWTVREAVVQALERVDRDAPAVRSALVGCALFDCQAEVRQAALDVLSHVEDEAVLPRIVRALADRRPRIRSRALLAAGRLWRGERVLAEVVRGMADPDARVRATAAGLASADACLLPRLVRCCFDRDERVSAAARASLRRIRPELPAGLQTWLLQLTATERASGNLQDALRCQPLPVAIEREFAEVRRRRMRWHYRRAPRAETAYRADRVPDVDYLLWWAGGDSDDSPWYEGEAAWLTGWLVGQLVRHHGTPP